MALFSRKLRKEPGWPKGSPGKRLYAIGDVHGCFEELVALLDLIKQDLRARPRKETHMVFLGDLIDRGPDSAAVIDLLARRPPDFAKCHFIRGNHEEMMVRCLTGEPRLISSWLEHGGRSCAVSYGVDPAQLYEPDPDRLEHLLLSHIPKDDLDFIAGFADQVRFGDYLLVHAGVRPGRPLAEQTGHDLRWIRGEFLSSDVPHEAMIVHGHTITEGVVRRPNRIGVDTGAYKTGILSAVRIEDMDFSVLMTNAERNNGLLASDRAESF